MIRDHWSFASISLLAALAVPRIAVGQVRLGSELQVNSYTTNVQSGASVAASAAGDFVVTWQSSQDGALYGVFARRFSSAGDALASEFQVNTYTSGTQLYPSVAMSASGDFVVAWQSNTQDGSGTGVFAHVFSSAGATLVGEFQVNAYTSGQQGKPTVAADPDGDFVVAWQSAIQEGSAYGVFARRFSSAGAPQTGELQVNSYTVGSQNLASVAAGVDGDFFVAWNSVHDGASGGVFGRLFSSAGVVLASELQVNTYTSSDQRDPSVATGAEGGFVVVWRSLGEKGLPSQFDLFGRRISSAGVPVGGELQINPYPSTRTSPSSPSVAPLAGGDFVVAWHVFGDGSDYGIFARRFSSAGSPLTNDFQVNSYTVTNQLSASVAASATGDFVVAWDSFNEDGQNYGVFAQRLAVPVTVTLDIDGNGSVQALTDGLLVLRALFGFTGTTLTGGDIGGGCTRCDGAAIKTYLDGLGSALDVDGNTITGALTDGLLVLRFLFGFTGTTLTSGAVGGGCTRCDAAAIEAYLAGLTQ